MLLTQQDLRGAVTDLAGAVRAVTDLAGSGRAVADSAGCGGAVADSAGSGGAVANPAGSGGGGHQTSTLRDNFLCAGKISLCDVLSKTKIDDRLIDMTTNEQTSVDLEIDKDAAEGESYILVVFDYRAVYSQLQYHWS